jgi:hypothetical protein
MYSPFVESIIALVHKLVHAKNALFGDLNLAELFSGACSSQASIKKFGIKIQKEL